MYDIGETGQARYQDFLRYAPEKVDGEAAILRVCIERAMAESGNYATYWQSYWPIMRARDQKILAAVKTAQTQADAMEAGAEEIKLTGQIPPDVLAEMDRQRE